MNAISRRRNAVFLICLIISTLGPCKAARLSNNHFDSANVSEFRSAGKRGTKACPEGLQLDKGRDACTYPDATGQTSELFTNYSDAMLVFSHSGIYMTDRQFAVEMDAAFADRSAVYRVGASLAEYETTTNASFAEAVAKLHMLEQEEEHWVEEDEVEQEVEQEAVSTQIGQWHSQFHIGPRFFVVEHAVDHTVVHGLEVGFHALAHAAEHATVFGEAVLAKTFGIESAAVALGTSAVASFVLHWVLPILFPIQALLLIRKMPATFKKQTHHAEDFSSHLVFKSDCVIENLKTITSSTDLQPVIGQVCGSSFEDIFQKQIHATVRANLELLDTIASFGRCLWPHGDRAWSKINCVETIYHNLLQNEGESGILYNALSFMAYYGMRLDELMQEPFLTTMYEKQFGIEKQAESVSLMPKIVAVKDLDIDQRFPVCMTLLASHRAFERTFQRLGLAVQVWARTYSRPMLGPSIRDTWWPCEKVFHKIKDGPTGFCKHFDWIVGHDSDERPIVENMPCKQSDNFTGSLWPETEKEHDM